jgi:hypothetical protein
LKPARAAVILVGIVLAAAGGVVAYRAAFVEPPTAVVISKEGVRETPSAPRVVGGVALLLVGAAIAAYAARRR